jgi:regulator of sigma E protease
MSVSILGGVIFVLVFAGIILTHEFGHFIASRMVGIDVLEFGIGFPPRLWRYWRARGSLMIGKQKVIIPSNTELPFDTKTAVPHVVEATADEVRGKLILRSIKFAATEDGQVAPESAPKKKPVKPMPETGAVRLTGPLNEIHIGTEFTLNWIPLGGFVLPKGEDNPDIRGGLASAAAWKRIFMLLAGAAMNLLTAVIVYSILFTQAGIPDTSRVIISDLVSGKVAETAGFKSGDAIKSVDGTAITTTDQLIGIINSHPNEALTITVQRGDQTLNITVTPQLDPIDNKGRIGVYIGYPIRPARSWFETIPLSFQTTYAAAQQLLALPGRFIAGTVTSQEAQIGGPRTVWNLFQQAVARDTASRQTTSTGTAPTPSYYTLLTIISLCITVGVANLLPIPALDGGRIFMSLIEVVIRRPIPAKYQAAINGAGFIIMLLLLGAFYIKDIISPATITLP